MGKMANGIMDNHRHTEELSAQELRQHMVTDHGWPDLPNGRQWNWDYETLQRTHAQGHEGNGTGKPFYQRETQQAAR